MQGSHATLEDCQEADPNGDGIIPLPDPSLDDDISDWGVIPDGYTNEEWRVERSARVWEWICQGGWWGSGCPDVRTLITMLLIGEGVGLLNVTSNPEADRVNGLKAMIGLMVYLFTDADGITAQDLSTFTAFFNPIRDSSGAWTQADRDRYQVGFDDYTWSIAISKVDDYWYAGPLYRDDHMVNKWWDNTENFSYVVVFYVNIPVQNQVLFFGY